MRGYLKTIAPRTILLIALFTTMSPDMGKLAIRVILATPFGAFAVGYLTERISESHLNGMAWLPGTGLLAAVPMYILGLSAGSSVLLTQLGEVKARVCLAASAE